MSKYYKADDVIRKRAEDLADTSYWEWGNPKNVDDWIEVAEMEFADLPTIEVMEYPQVEGITPTLITPEVGEDCISREDAVNAIMAHFIPQTYTGDDVDRASKLARKIMANVPSVTTEQSSIVGEWNWKSQDICDNCGYEIPHLQRIVGETVLMDSKDWSYCPNCGCRMKGADNE